VKLGLYLLETCRLRQERAKGWALVEAEWWEARVRHGLELWQAMEDLEKARAARRSGLQRGGEKRDD